MPRKSVASLAVAGQASHLTHRPGPPADLTAIQKAYWVEISNSLPAEWWQDDNKSLLAEYVRTLSTLALLNQSVDVMEATGELQLGYMSLLKRREAMVRVMLTQATKMRLTQQSRYADRVAAGKAAKPRAKGTTWEFS